MENQNALFSSKEAVIEHIAKIITAHVTLGVLVNPEAYDKTDGFNTQGDTLETPRSLFIMLADAYQGMFDISTDAITAIMNSLIPDDLFTGATS